MSNPKVVPTDAATATWRWVLVSFSAIGADDPGRTVFTSDGGVRMLWPHDGSAMSIAIAPDGEVAFDLTMQPMEGV